MNAEDQEKVSPLCRAARCCEVVRLLLEHRAIDPNEICGSFTALSHAARMGFLDIVDIILTDKRTLLGCDCAGDQNALAWAACMGHTLVVKRLLRDPRVYTGPVYLESWDPLVMAREEGHREIVHLPQEAWEGLSSD